MSSCSHCINLRRVLKHKRYSEFGEARYIYMMTCRVLEDRVKAKIYYLDILTYSEHPYKTFLSDCPAFERRPKQRYEKAGPGPGDAPGPAPGPRLF